MDSLPASQSAIWLGVLATGLWAVGAAQQGRLTMTEVLLIEAAALATATSALGLVELHRVFKPLALGFALVFVAVRAYSMRLQADLTCIFWGDWPFRWPVTAF